MKDVEREYVDLMGKQPPKDESEQAWQWDYRGRSDEDKERLAGLLEEQPPEISDDQESLF